MRNQLINRPVLFAVACAAGLAFPGAAGAAISYTTSTAPGAPGNPFRDPFAGQTLSGATSTSQWLNVAARGFVAKEDGGTGDTGPITAYPGTGSWTKPFDAQVGDTNAKIIKVENGAGGGIIRSSTSIYAAGTSTVQNYYGGMLAVTDAQPIPDLKTLVLQLQITEGLGYDFYNAALPVLSYRTSHGGEVNDLLPDFWGNLLTFDNGSFKIPGTDDEAPLRLNTYALQWNLAEEDISEFTISYKVVQHAMTHGMRLDQSADDFSSINLVPEPSALLLGLLGAGLVAVRRRG